MVVVSKALIHKISALFFLTSSTKFVTKIHLCYVDHLKALRRFQHGSHQVLADIGLKSPFTVPMTTLPMVVEAPPPAIKASSSKAPFMARPAVNSWGTNAFPSWKRCPLHT